MVAFPAGAVVHKQNQIVAAFRAAGATTRERATSVAALGVHEGLAFRLLCRHAILRDAAGQGLWLEETAWAEHCARRRRLAIAMSGVALLLILLLCAWALGR